MKVLLINSVCGIGSTGRICIDLAQQYEKEGHEVKIAYGREKYVPEKFKKYAVRIGNDLDVKLHGVRTRILDEHGFGSKRATKKFLKWAEEYNPDLVWLHNLHGYYINVELLFAWIKSRPNMQVKWTLHDCWAFTGHCSHFEKIDCNKWKSGCKRCPQKSMYPCSKLKDNCKNNYLKKKNIFTDAPNLTLITPSKWLADLTRESFLCQYPVKVKYNTIDTNIFKPTKSDFRERYGLADKKIILGVASTWSERKGIYDFIRLSKLLNDDYEVVLVGISDSELSKFGKKSIEKLQPRARTTEIIEEEGGTAIPCDVYIAYEILTGEKYSGKVNEFSRIICIERTNDASELAGIYSSADVFVNFTYEETYPTVNLEARACGTRVLTYNVGGCLETIL